MVVVVGSLVLVTAIPVVVVVVVVMYVPRWAQTGALLRTPQTWNRLSSNPGDEKLQSCAKRRRNIAQKWHGADSHCSLCVVVVVVGSRRCWCWCWQCGECCDMPNVARGDWQVSHHHARPFVVFGWWGVWTCRTVPFPYCAHVPSHAAIEIETEPPWPWQCGPVLDSTARYVLT